MLRFSTFLAAALFTATATAFAAAPGEPAPAFSAVDVITGKTVSNESLKGNITVLEWNNFNCPFVHKFYDSGTMQKLQAEAVKGGVVWVSVNSSAEGKEGYLKDAATAKKEIAAHKNHATHYLLDHDGKIGHAFGAKSTPTMVVLDAAGNIAYEGAIDSIPSPHIEDIAQATNYVTEAITSLKAGEPVKVPSTRAYGCFVKY